MSISTVSTVESPFVLPCYVCLMLCKKKAVNQMKVLLQPAKAVHAATRECQKKKTCSVSIVFNKHVLLFTLKVNQGDASEAADGEQETGEE